MEVMREEERPANALFSSCQYEEHETGHKDLRGAFLNVVDVRLNCNMLSNTLDRLREVRKKQVTEVSNLIEKELRIENGVVGPDIQERRN
eukprot:SAG31_NODE_21663_length_544_cov_0.382022_2_plen_89_part_01